MAKITIDAGPQKREAGNWLRAYLEYTKESESPDSYHIWVGLSSLAAVVRRNVWIDQALYVLYPNLYVALVGPPARTAKSTAIRLGRRLIQPVPGVVLGPDSCTREQLIKKMAEAKYDNQCALTVHSSEMSSLLDPSGVMMIQFLTDIYDCDYANPTGWKYETKTQGKDTLVNPYLNMLVGTTPSYLAESLPAHAVEHGFTSRTIFVFAERERLRNPLPVLEDPSLAGLLVNDLRYISGLSGQFAWSDEAKELYKEFYNDLYERPPGDERLEGYHWRKKTHILKVAMLLSLAERDELVLQPQDIEAAKAFLDAIEPNIIRVFSAVGKYEHATDVEKISAMVWKAGGMSTSDLFRRCYHMGSGDELRLIISTLTRIGSVRLINKGGEEFLVPGSKALL